MKAALQNYHARTQRVIDYIDQHLDGDLDLETVSRVAAFSKFHFHRQFTATFELSVHRYVQLALLQRVRAFDAFTEDNDPHGEHDFGSIDEGGVRCFWKIDYYDRATEMGSPDPADPAVTTRVLTIMLADECWARGAHLDRPAAHPRPRRHSSSNDLTSADAPIAGRFSPRL